MKGYRLLAALAATLLTMGVASVPPAATQETPAQKAGPQENDYAKREKNAPQKVKDDLAELRREIKEKKLTYTVAYTEAADHKPEELFGTVDPPDLPERARKQNEVARQKLAEEEARRAEFRKKNPDKKLPEEAEQEEVRKEFKRRNPGASMPDEEQAHASSQVATATAWDWRWRGKVTPVRNQGKCNSCWAFALAAAYEGSYLKLKNLTAPDYRDLTVANVSEQSIVSCSRTPSSCGPGNGSVAAQFLETKGAPPEVKFPYAALTGTAPPCKVVTPVPFKAVTHGYVIPTGGKPTVAQLKAALIKYGPLYISVEITKPFFYYAGGVFNSPSSPTNPLLGYHAVTLIGWSDAKRAWLIKNSWGEFWGENGGFGDPLDPWGKGYMWIGYAVPGAGQSAMWVMAKTDLL